jgi:pSer/pThr/pTyr-binding forkhead associated (FHA) protein
MGGYLVVVDQTNLPSFLAFSLETGETVLGRSPECDHVINHPTVSRRHAKVVVTETSITVADLGSRNGTYIDGLRVGESSTIAEGQQLCLGAVTFVLASNEPESPEPGEVKTKSCPRGAPLTSADGVKLPPGQERVFKELLNGLSEKEIAARLRLSRHTVHNHVRAILGRFAFHSRSELLAAFVSKR